MKRRYLFLIVVTLCSVAFGLTYSGEYYRQHMSDNLSGNPNTDPLYLHMIEVDNLIGVNGPIGTGQVFYVDSGVSSEGDGSSWTKAKDTLDEAVNLCTAGRGDFILVAQGHTEAMGAAADEVDINVAGVTVIGIGNGTLRPLFDYTGDVTGAFAIGAANVTITNLVFKANVPDVNDAIDVEAAGDNSYIANCDFIVVTAGTDEFSDCISYGDAADNGTVQGCLFDMEDGAAEAGIHMDFDTDGMTIRGNTIRGDYSAACIQGDTTLSTNLMILDNILWNGVTANLNTVECIELLTGTVGIIKGNFLACNVATVDAAMVGDGVFLFDNWYNEDAGIDKTAVNWHVYDANDNIASSVTPSGDG